MSKGLNLRDLLEIRLKNYSEHTIKSVKTIDTHLEELQKELLKRANSKMDYENIAEEIYALREQKQSALEKAAECEGEKQRMEDMMTFLNEQPSEIEEHDDNLVRRLIQKVTIYEDRYMVEFKSGMQIDITI